MKAYECAFLSFVGPKIFVSPHISCIHRALHMVLWTCHHSWVSPLFEGTQPWQGEEARRPVITTRWEEPRPMEARALGQEEWQA